MKAALFLTTQVLAFIAALMIAGLMPANDPAMHKEQSNRSSPRKRAAVMEDSESSAIDIPMVLADLEHRIVHFPPPEVKVHDSKGMEECLMNDGHGPSTCGSGMTSIEYSLDWARENPAGMFGWFNHHWTVSGYKRQSLAEILFSEWAEQDIAAALAAIPRMTHAETRAQALISSLEILCQKDPAKARELLLQNLDSLEALKSVQFGFEAGNARTELILNLPTGRLRSLLLAENINNLVADYREDNAALAAELWKRFSIDEQRDLVAAGLRLSGFDEIHFDGLEDLVRQHTETSNDPGKASLFLNRYGESWAKRDPDGALAWALAHLKGKERTDCSLDLLKHAASLNFDAAMLALKNLPEGSLRDQAVEMLVDEAPEGRDAEKVLLQNSLPQPGKW